MTSINNPIQCAVLKFKDLFSLTIRKLSFGRNYSKNKQKEPCTLAIKASIEMNDHSTRLSV